MKETLSYVIKRSFNFIASNIKIITEKWVEGKMRHHRTKSVRLLKAQYKIYDKKHTIRDIQIIINENETRQLSLQVKKGKKKHKNQRMSIKCSLIERVNILSNLKKTNVALPRKGNLS